MTMVLRVTTTVVLLATAAICAPLETGSTEVSTEYKDHVKKEKGGLHVLVAPSLGTKLSQRVLRKGEKLVLECEAFGAPTPKIYWSFNGHRLQTNRFYDKSSRDLEALLNARITTLEHTNTKSILEIACFNEENEGIYGCVAESGSAKSDVSHAAVMLEEESRNEIPQCLAEEQRSPVMHIWSSLRLERENAYIQLMCRSSGGGVSEEEVPQWFQMEGEDNWTTIGSSSINFTILDSGDLLVKPSVTCHTGGCFFACVKGGRKMDVFVYETSVGFSLNTIRCEEEKH